MLLPKQLLVFVLLINEVVGLVAANHVVAGLGAEWKPAKKKVA